MEEIKRRFVYQSLDVFLEFEWLEHELDLHELEEVEYLRDFNLCASGHVFGKTLHTLAYFPL